METPQIALATLNSLSDFSSVSALRGKFACRVWTVVTAHESQLPRAISRALAKATYNIFAFVASSDIFPLATAIRIVLERSWMYRQFFTQLTDFWLSSRILEAGCTDSSSHNLLTFDYRRES